ncbi:MAG: hypothetical protein J6S57_00310 [Alphaproteobacteria bacterium]|nr:hypothetical protein [Alphaproteobacteria bacterium]
MNANIELTIENFFKSVYTYVDGIAELYTKQNDKDAIKAQIETIKNQQKQIQEMMLAHSKGADAYKLNQMQWNIITAGTPGWQAFIKPGSVDNSALVAYRDVIRGITEYLYYGLREESFLKPLKQWNYVISNRLLKDLIYPFLPLKHFMVKKENAMMVVTNINQLLR